MSISLDKLKALRRQAGHATTPGPAAGVAPGGLGPSVATQPPAHATPSRPETSAAAVTADVPVASRLTSLQRPAPVAPPASPTPRLQDGDGPQGLAAPSINLDKLKALRRQAGHATAPRSAVEAPATPRETSVFGWVEQLQHKPVTAIQASLPAADAEARPEMQAAPPTPVRQPPDSAALRRLLGMRGRAIGIGAKPPVTAQDRHVPGEEIAPGLFLIESFLPQPVPQQPLSLAFSKRPLEAVAPRDLLFFDTETTGLAGGTGTRAFMIGAADWHTHAEHGDGLRIRQLLMTTMAAETAMLHEFTGWLGAATVFSSYNGRCYDAPLLKTRYRLARQPDPISALDHVDLLFPTRRRYRGVWENCRLATIERQLLHIVREDDLPGSEAPAAWLNYLRGGSAHNLRRVAAHNHQDVVTLAQLFLRLVEEQRNDELRLELEAPASAPERA
ncbi:MAG: ribonuclease H-like domain-containing protein [Stenotrophomonas sp.]